MHLGLSQHMRMSQQMRLAPRMIQSMEILQLPIMALKERIEQELIENPLLEEPAIENDGPGTIEPVEPSDGPVVEKPVEQKELLVDSNDNNKDDFERLTEMSPDEWPDDDYSYSPRVSSNRMDEEGDRAHDAIANLVERPESIQTHLLEQFRYFTCSIEIREFAEFLIQNLDGNGRMPSPLEEIVQVYESTGGRPIALDDAQRTLSLIQKLDPPGVGARDLKECFLLQIGPTTPLRDVLVTLITSHLEDLAENRLPLIERKTGYDIELIKEAREELQNLNPWPGRDFQSVSAPSVTPDLFIEQNASGKYVVRLEDEYTPRLNISRKYQQLLANGQADQQTKDYIKRKIESARWLIESIEQRYNTLKRVAQAIVDHQTAFLEHGPEAIVPLKMQQIADVVGVHVTTVSRAVDDKYVQTPRGIFALKRFFGGGTTTTGGEEVAWDIIRIKLKEIIAAEDKNRPLSDDDLVKELAKYGYELARRTITKYRKALKIPSSRQRRAY
ncbi:MAG: RNA polymerase sigma-54 factor [Planctomycetaceae bacterium]|nr:RNA polymerase sigma-54 factor [Planctomycetaceae bacterium]